VSVQFIVCESGRVGELFVSSPIKWLNLSMNDTGDHQGVLQSYDAFKARALMPNELILLSVIKALFSCQQHARAYVRVLQFVAICLCHASCFGRVRRYRLLIIRVRLLTPSTNCAWPKQPASSSRKGFAAVSFEVHFD